VSAEAPAAGNEARNEAGNEAGTAAELRAARTHEARLLGLAVGLSVGPAGGFVQAWSGNADGRWHVWLLMSAVGALVGAASLPVFVPRAPDGVAGAGDAGVARALGLGWLTLFGFVVAVVAGTFAAFPVGASMGGVGGAAAGLVAGLVWHVRRLEGSRWRTPLAALAATLAALMVVVWWTA